MGTDDFEAPPLQWRLLSIVGGIVSAITLIWGLEHWSTQLTRQHLLSAPECTTLSCKTSQE